MDTIKNEYIINRVLHGDCLEISNEIESGSIDLILTDLPYGTLEKMGNSENIKYGKMILFSQEPYTTILINESHSNVPFNYRMIWEKDHFANSLIAKKAPVSYYEK